MNKNIIQKEELEEENRELRKVIWNMKVVDDLRTHVEVRIQDNKIGLQEKSRIKERMKTVTVGDVKEDNLMSKLDLLKNSKDKRGKRLKTVIDLSPK